MNFPNQQLLTSAHTSQDVATKFRLRWRFPKDHQFPITVWRLLVSQTRDWTKEVFQNLVSCDRKVALGCDIRIIKLKRAILSQRAQECFFRHQRTRVSLPHTPSVDWGHSADVFHVASFVWSSSCPLTAPRSGQFLTIISCRVSVIDWRSCPRLLFTSGCCVRIC